MKTTLILITLLWLPMTVTAEGGQVMQIGVSGMVCGFCSASVEKKLKALPGVQQVNVSLEDKRAQIVMAAGQSLDADSVRKIIADAGFTPGEITTRPGESR